MHLGVDSRICRNDAVVGEAVMVETLFLFLAGLLGGAVNSLAGGGSFIVFPALLFVGVTPVVANASNTYAALPGYASGAFGYWQAMAKYKDRLVKVDGDLEVLLAAQQLHADQSALEGLLKIGAMHVLADLERRESAVGQARASTRLSRLEYGSREPARPRSRAVPGRPTRAWHLS